MGHPAAVSLCVAGLGADARIERCAAARAARRLGAPQLQPALIRAFVAAHGDPFLRSAVLDALQRVDSGRHATLAVAFAAGLGPVASKRYAGLALQDVPACTMTDWEVLGHLPGDPDDPARVVYAPESDAAADADLPSGERRRWRARRADSGGRLSLDELDGPSDGSVAYARCAVYSERSARVVFALGSDDGCRLWIGARPVHENGARRSARPFDDVGTVDLSAGWNPILIKVVNGSGRSAAYLRFFGPGLRGGAWTSAPAK